MAGDLEPLMPEDSIECYAQNGNHIGQGGQGAVYKYIYRRTGNVYAAKVLYCRDKLGATKQKRDIVREQSFAPKIDHAHLMKAHEVFEYPEGFVIVMPYCSRGSLADLEPDPTELKDAIRQILEALRYLHEHGFIHRNIKPSNVLVSSSKGERLHVVADYRLMTLHNPVSFVGTQSYMAPEIVRNAKIYDDSKQAQYDNKVDIYALGILILRMLDLAIPHDGFEIQKEFTKRVKSLIAEASDKCPQYDFDRFDILTMADRMLQFAAIIRPSADECLKLPCLALATAAPAAMKRPRSESVSTNKSGASVPVKPPAKDYWGKHQV